jgi:elongator complex protein 2
LIASKPSQRLLTHFLADLILAVGLTEKKIRLYTSLAISPKSSPNFNFALPLEGHEDWVRCLDFTTYPRHGTDSKASDLMLATGSHDGYIRLWNVTRLEQEDPQEEKKVNNDGALLDDAMLDEFEREITGETGSSRQINTKAHVISVGGERLVPFRSINTKHSDPDRCGSWQLNTLWDIPRSTTHWP